MCNSAMSSVMVVSHKVFVYFLFYMTFANFAKNSRTFPCRTKDRGRDDIVTRGKRTERGLPFDVLTPPQTKNSKSERIKYSRFNCRTRYTYVRTHCFVSEIFVYRCGRSRTQAFCGTETPVDPGFGEPTKNHVCSLKSMGRAKCADNGRAALMDPGADF